MDGSGTGIAPSDWAARKKDRNVAAPPTQRTHAVVGPDALSRELDRRCADEGVEIGEGVRGGQRLAAKERDLGDGRAPEAVRGDALREHGGKCQPGIGHESPGAPRRSPAPDGRSAELSLSVRMALIERASPRCERLEG